VWHDEVLLSRLKSGTLDDPLLQARIHRSFPPWACAPAPKRVGANDHLTCLTFITRHLQDAAIRRRTGKINQLG